MDFAPGRGDPTPPPPPPQQEHCACVTDIREVTNAHITIM